MTAPRLDGLDIHDVYQPVTDWAAATNYRLMSCKVTDGTGSPRPGGLAYFRKFREHGVPLRGIYHWLRSTSSMQAQVARLAQAIEALGGLQAGEFIQLDWETTPGIPNVSVEQVVEWLALVDARWPDRTIVYASDWVPGFAEWRKRDPDRPVWYANYNTSDKPTGGWAECARWGATVWQWTSSAMVPGIATRCDGNHVFDWAALERIAHVGPVAVEPPVPPSLPGLGSDTGRPIPLILQGDDDMSALAPFIWKDKRYSNEFLVEGTGARPITNEEKQLHPQIGSLPLIEATHDQTLDSLLAKSGLTRAALV